MHILTCFDHIYAYLDMFFIQQNGFLKKKECDFVFTHNPMGEYGHIDHKMIFELMYNRVDKPLLITDLLQSGEQATGGEVKAEVGRTNDQSSVNTVRGFQAIWNNGMTADYAASEVFNHAQNGRFYCILDNLKCFILR